MAASPRAMLGYAPPLMAALAALAAAAPPAAAAAAAPPPAAAPAPPAGSAAPGGSAGGDELALLQVRQDIQDALQRVALNHAQVQQGAGYQGSQNDTNAAAFVGGGRRSPLTVGRYSDEEVQQGADFQGLQNETNTDALVSGEQRSLLTVRRYDYEVAGWCKDGIMSGRRCCAASCNTCGGNGCASRPGGYHKCCSSGIKEFTCKSTGDTGCTLPEQAPLTGWCKNGIKSGKACCAASCGTCGGSGCNKRPGGGSKCCTSDVRSRRTCTSKSDTVCRIPDPTTAPQATTTSAAPTATTQATTTISVAPTATTQATTTNAAPSTTTQATTTSAAPTATTQATTTIRVAPTATTQATTTIRVAPTATTQATTTSAVPSTTTQACSGEACSVYADPHVSTFDAVGRGVPDYLALIETGACSHRPVDVNAYETGDFWIVKSKDVQIQGRFVHSQEFVPDRAALGALVVAGPALRGGKLLLEPMNGHVAWAGQPLGEPAGIDANRTGGVLGLASWPGPQPGSRRIEAELPRGLRLVAVRFNKHLDVKFTMPNAFGARDGLCGNSNGVEDDDAEEDVRARLGSLSVAPSELLFEGSEHS